MTKPQFTMEDEAPTARPSGESRDDKIREWLKYDAQVKEASDKRKGYAIDLAAEAFGEADGQKTVHLPASDGSQVKVEFGTELKVVEEGEIETLKVLLGERFDKIFDTVYKPKAKNFKLFINTVFPDEKMNTAKAILKEAVKEVPKTPYVSCEKRA